MSKKDVARQIRPRRDRVVVGVELDNQVFVYRTIREEAEARGWRLVNLYLYQGGLPAGVELRGVLTSRLPDHERVRKLRDEGCAVVRLGKLPHPDDATAPAVLPDLHAQGRLAAEHFFERGFRHVGYYGSDPWGDCRDMFEGLRSQAEDLNMRCHLHRFRRDAGGGFGEDLIPQKKRDFMAWLDEVPKPIGLLAWGDWQTAQLCVWADEVGHGVPSDVAVLAPGRSLDVCENAIPTLSSLDCNDEGVMRTTCDLLDRMMAGEPVPKEPVMMPPKGVVERESTNVLATPDEVVAAALSYMWDHFARDLSVDDVAAEVGLSSRQLARRFQRALNRTFSEELLRKRLKEFRHLLRSTDYSIENLAPAVGFRTIPYLYQTFRAAYGMTPSQYRRSRK